MHVRTPCVSLTSGKRANVACSRAATKPPRAYAFSLPSPFNEAQRRADPVARIEVIKLKEGDKLRFKALFELNDMSKVPSSSLQVIASSSSIYSGPVLESFLRDTFEDYEDMQGGCWDETQCHEDAGEDIGSPLQSRAHVPGRPATSGTHPAAGDELVMLVDSVDSDGMYGDGGAWAPAAKESQNMLMTPAALVSSIATSIGPIAAAGNSVAAQLAKATEAAAARVWSAVSAAHETTSQSHWVALDSPDGVSRVIILVASSEVVHAVQQRNASDMMVFEGSRHAVVSSVIMDEARRLLVQLLPLVVDAAESGMTVTLTGTGASGCLASVLTLLCTRRGLGTSSGINAVVFNSPPCIGEHADSTWCDQQGCNLQDEQEMVDEILSRGLLAELGLPSEILTHVFVTNTQQPSGTTNSNTNQGMRHSPLQTLGSQAARSGLMLPGMLGASGSSWEVDEPQSQVLRSEDGKHITLYKTLGQAVALAL